MKKLMLLTIIALSVVLPASGQDSKGPKKETAPREYFLAIPSDFLKADAKKRASWITHESNDNGYLEFEIPLKEILGDEEGDGKAFGSLLVFKKKSGGVVIGMATNMCAENTCIGQALLLENSNGKWSDSTSDLAPLIDNDEVAKILKESPAYKKPVKPGVEIPLAIQFSAGEKLIEYVAGCQTNCDGGVVALSFKWNGEIFESFEFEESPE